jgi:hypothetical protein
MDVQSLIDKNCILDGSSEIDRRFSHLSTEKHLSLGRRLMPEGRLKNPFPDKFKSLRKDKLPRSMELIASDKPASLRSSSFNELKLVKEAGSIAIELEQLFGETHDENLENRDLDGGSGEQKTFLYPPNDNFVSFFKYLADVGSCLIAVPFANNFVKDSRSPKLSGNFSSCEHAVTLRV